MYVREICEDQTSSLLLSCIRKRYHDNHLQMLTVNVTQHMLGRNRYHDDDIIWQNIHNFTKTKLLSDLSPSCMFQVQIPTLSSFHEMS